MTEAQPNFEKFFPNPEKRELVASFLSWLPDPFGVIEKVVAVETGKQEPFQRLIVMTEGSSGFPTSAEQDEVVLVKKYACKNRKEAALLGYIPLFTQQLFEEEKGYYEELQGKEVHVLWQKPAPEKL